MDKTVFLCVGGDARQIYTANYLAELGRVYTMGIDSMGGKCRRLDSLEQMTEKAHVLVLPIIKNDGCEITVRDGKSIACGEIAEHLAKNALVTGGMLRREQIEFFSSLGFDVRDYYKREELVIRNCIPTAEGALQIAMQELACTVNGCETLVIGYGRVGKACAKLFKAVGADVLVTARRLSSLAEAENDGLGAFPLSELYGRAPRLELIINTVPAMMLDEGLLGAVSKNALVIDLASKPGGVDFEAASRLNRRVVWALSLPGKAAPMTGGEIIARAVVNILQERGT